MKIAIAAITFLTLVACDPCRTGSDDEIAQCLASRPKEDIRKTGLIKTYLEKHKVYVSLTTSPKRIENVVYVLKTLDLNLIEKIFISLPDKYRNEEAYVIPQALTNFPKVEILQGGTDLGPIMKLLPAVKKVRDLGDLDAIVVTIDDDIGYDADVLGQLVKHAIIYNAAAGSHGTNVDVWKVDGAIWPLTPRPFPGCYSGYDIGYCDMLEGFGGVAYPVKLVDTELLASLSQLNKACKTSDDIVIGFGLALTGSPRVVVTTIPFFSAVVPFEYGLQGDALQQGSGFSIGGAVGNNPVRYPECARTMNEWTKSRG